MKKALAQVLIYAAYIGLLQAFGLRVEGLLDAIAVGLATGLMAALIDAVERA